ncbi:hypothetical protein CBS101457_000132 [Exobasidium rhododendri]|nr:hypothetical protein CBS101457_000132 [Exobasidium rhododendri]
MSAGKSLQRGYNSSYRDALEPKSSDHYAARSRQRSKEPLHFYAEHGFQASTNTSRPDSSQSVDTTNGQHAARTGLVQKTERSPLYRSRPLAQQEHGVSCSGKQDLASSSFPDSLKRSTRETVRQQLALTKNRRGRPESPQKTDKAAKHAWSTYPAYLKQDILDVLHLYTGLLRESVAVKCRKLITDEMVTALFSGNEKQIMAVRDILFRRNANNHLEQTWMENMTMEESKVAVHKMAVASETSEEHTRNHFLRIRLSQEMAGRILKASTAEECKMLVKMIGLDRPSTSTFSLYQ